MSKRKESLNDIAKTVDKLMKTEVSEARVLLDDHVKFVKDELSEFDCDWKRSPDEANDEVEDEDEEDTYFN
jgi:hypothetical protein